MNLVIDCSFAMSQILPDELESVRPDDYYEKFDNIQKIFVPSIFYLECNNVLLSSLKRNRILLKDYNEYINLISDLPVEVDNFSGTRESLSMIGNLSKKYSITSYDASYIELALRKNAFFASFDKKLTNLCKDLNIMLCY